MIARFDRLSTMGGALAAGVAKDLQIRSFLDNSGDFR